MKIAIMQPYFFPYIGYFQLIHSVGTYVNLDHVSFMKRSYMVRNVLKEGNMIGLQVYGGSQNKRCKDVIVNFENIWIRKTYKMLSHLYSKEKNFDEIMDSIIVPNIREEEISVSDFNLRIIRDICRYLEIERNFILTSETITNNKKDDGLIDICQRYNHQTYVNAIGGKNLYSKEKFLDRGIKLEFCRMDDDLELDNPYNSILDALFLYTKEHLQKQIEKYTLV